MKLKSILFFAVLVISFYSQSQSQNGLSVYPSNWWVGMKNSSLQLMIHSNYDVPSSIKIDRAGITIKKVFQPENKHYLFVDLAISPSAKPGIYSFILNNGEKIKYELKARSNQAKTKQNQGVYASDLVYLIMPDRFSNGDASNDTFTDLRDTSSDRNNPYIRHGGDLKGVSNKFDYLKSIGVTSIWMTPLLENDMPIMQEGPYQMAGYHGYWITDHFKIDKRYGGNQGYKEMVSQAHQKGLKIIQDAVYNHVGEYHHTVLDMPMPDWLNQWPTTYQGTNHREEVFIDPHASEADKKIMVKGWFVPHLPDLNLANPYCANYIMQSSIWATEEFGIDGWRIDTYKYCDEQFLNKINDRLALEFPKLTVFGEAVSNSVSATAYFSKNNINSPFKHNLQGVLDFPISHSILDAVNQNFGWNEGVSKLYTTLAEDFLYKDPMRNCIFLDNHDTNRFFSLIGEDINKYKMALGLLFTLRGIPQVYYGTEVLTKNFMNPNDAAVRKDFPGGWTNDSLNKFIPQNLSSLEKEAFEYFQQLATFRKGSIAIAEGSLKQFIPQQGIYVYFRIHQKQTLMCIVNTNSSSSELNLDRFAEVNSKFHNIKNVLSQKNIQKSSSITIPSKSFQLFELIN